MTATGRLWVTAIAVVAGALLLNAERDDPDPEVEADASVGLQVPDGSAADAGAAAPGLELPDGADEDGDGADAGGNDADGTATADAAAVPVDGASRSCDMTVTATLLNVREGPGFRHAVVDRFPDGTGVLAVDVVENGWRRLADGRWAHNDFLTGSCG